MSERVRFSCPGCGSELETPEGTVSNSCTFCGLVSLLGRPGRIVKRYYAASCDAQEARVIADRQVKKDGLPLLASATVELHYVPFYRFRGLALDCLSSKKPSTSGWAPDADSKTYELRARHVDVTTPACSLNPFGLTSLGVRPQAVTAWAFRDEEMSRSACVWPVDRTPKEAEAAALRMNDAGLVLAHGNATREHSEMVGEHQALIYFPVILIWGRTGTPTTPVTIALDGLSKRVISTSRKAWSRPWMPEAITLESLPKPEPHRCPNCGQDLPASERSLYYFCRNCSRPWFLSQDGYQPVAMAYVGEGVGELYPFWRVPLSFERPPGINTVGAFSKFLTADIPLLDKRKRHLPFYVYVPAFAGADADWHVQMAVRMTRMQPLVEPTGPGLRAETAVSLPSPEGRQFARFAWDWLRLSYMNMRGAHFAWECGSTGSPELAWLPAGSERLERSTSRAGQERSRAF